MDKHAIALVLEEIATLLDVSGDNRFKARAFQRAARVLDKLDQDPADLIATGELLTIGGIGPATARVIEELVATGRSKYHEELRQRAPSGMRELLRVPGLGARKIALLHSELGVRDLQSLETAAHSGAIARLRGFGERTQQRILEGIPFARGASERRRFHQVIDVAMRVSGLIDAVPGVLHAELAGEVRRCVETVNGISVVAAIDGASSRLLQTLRSVPGLQWQEPLPGQLTGRLADGLELDVRTAPKQLFGVALLYGTGSDTHVARLEQIAAERGLTLDAKGLRRGSELIETPEEIDVYRALGLPWIAPELRESGSEIELARANRLPVLVTFDDLRGCFHCHTTYSDGRNTVQEMAEAAVELGWSYLGIADHSRNAGYAGGLSPAQLRAQKREIAAWNKQRGDELWLFAGIEADILVDGSLDYAAQGEPEVLDALDFVIGSVHSAFGIGHDAMTKRVLQAVSDPRLTMLGHATGRLLLTREGYEIDIDAVIDRAAETGAVIEINADPHRLDLSWQYWPPARERGVNTSINPDAHSAGSLYNVRYGVNIARKAALGPESVVNAWPLDEVREFLKSRKSRV